MDFKIIQNYDLQLVPIPVEIRTARRPPMGQHE